MKGKEEGSYPMSIILPPSISLVFDLILLLITVWWVGFLLMFFIIVALFSDDLFTFELPLIAILLLVSVTAGITKLLVLILTFWVNLARRVKEGRNFEGSMTLLVIESVVFVIVMSGVILLLVLVPFIASLREEDAFGMAMVLSITIGTALFNWLIVRFPANYLRRRGDGRATVPSQVAIIPLMFILVTFPAMLLAGRYESGPIDAVVQANFLFYHLLIVVLSASSTIMLLRRFNRWGKADARKDARDARESIGPRSGRKRTIKAND